MTTQTGNGKRQILYVENESSFALNAVVSIESQLKIL